MRPTVDDYIRNYERAVQDIEEKNDPLQIALNKTFGLKHQADLVPGPRGLLRVTQGAAYPPGPGFHSLGEAYVAFTGDSEFQRVGQPRILQSSTADFPAALANTMNALLLREYAGDSVYRWREIVTDFSSPQNFKPQQRSRLRYMEDLPDVADDAPYDELVTHGDEGFSFNVNAKGGLLTLTRRMIVNDDVGAVTRLVAQAARAAGRTLARRAWTTIINNENYLVDSLPMFNAAHGGNLGSAALSVTALNAARAVIFAQTEPGSTERLGLSGPWMLVVPVELETVAQAINNCAFVPGTTDGSGNPWYQKFGPDGERIFTNPFFQDANDWCLFDISGNVSILEAAFLMGHQTPEIHVAQDPREGQTFSQDRITYKVRHEYELAIRDFRGSYKAVVT
jgi:hypothetical protein